LKKKLGSDEQCKATKEFCSAIHTLYLKSYVRRKRGK